MPSQEIQPGIDIQGKPLRDCWLGDAGPQILIQQQASSEQEYNNTSSYPTSIRAAKIKVLPTTKKLAGSQKLVILNTCKTTTFSSWSSTTSKVGTVRNNRCNSLYGRDVPRTGKFCAGGKVDACQVKNVQKRWNFEILPGGFGRPPCVQTPWTLSSCRNYQQRKRVTPNTTIRGGSL